MKTDAKVIPFENVVCSNCANKGKINGLSQETFCEFCVYGVKFRRDFYVPINEKQKGVIYE